MDRLKAMEIYVRVVRAGSFAAAADELGLSRPLVTKQVMGLEKQLGARLINRTTRRFSVTEIGRGYFDFCVRVLEEMAAQDALVASLQQAPRGELKVLAPKSFGGLHLGDILADFTTRYPDIRVSLTLSDLSSRMYDLIEHGFDLAIHLTSQSDSNLIAKRLGAVRWVACAAPAYLAAHGVPASPEDLAGHACLLHSKSADGVWRLHGPSGKTAVRVAGAIVSNSVIVLRQAALAGKGIALLPTYCVGPELSSGALRRVLPGHGGPNESIYAVFPHRNLVTAKVRAFIDFLAERISAAPWDAQAAKAPAARAAARARR